VSLVFLLVQSVLQVLGPLLTKIAVDRYLDPRLERAPTMLDRFLSADPWTAPLLVAGQKDSLYSSIGSRMPVLFGAR